MRANRCACSSIVSSPAAAKCRLAVTVTHMSPRRQHGGSVHGGHRRCLCPGWTCTCRCSWACSTVPHARGRGQPYVVAVQCHLHAVLAAKAWQCGVGIPLDMLLGNRWPLGLRNPDARLFNRARKDAARHWARPQSRNSTSLSHECRSGRSLCGCCVR